MLSNAANLPDGMISADAATVNVQVVGLCYNPTAFPEPPTRWEQIFESPYVERLGLTGFQTTFGTVSLIEMAKVFGGSDTEWSRSLQSCRKRFPKSRRLPVRQGCRDFPAGSD